MTGQGMFTVLQHNQGNLQEQSCGSSYNVQMV